MTNVSSTHHERYLALYDLVSKQDRKLAAAFNEHRRSTALTQTMQIYALGLLTDEEFAGFSETTKTCVLAVVKGIGPGRGYG